MKNNEMMKINEKSIFYKFKMIFFYLKNKLFKDKNKHKIDDSVDEDDRHNEKNKFREEIKIKDSEIVNNPFEKEEFLKSLDGNIEKLSMLSIERLEKLEEYYQNIIDKNEAEIKRLKMEN